VSKTNGTRAILVESHPLIRRGLSVSLTREAGVRFCCEAESAEQAIQVIRDKKPDVAVIDLELNESGGIDLIHLLHRTRPAMPIVVLSEKSGCARSALQAGATGYVSKRDPETEVSHAVQMALGGKRYVSESVLDQLLEEEIGASPTEPHLVLSSRELQIFKLIGHGLRGREIATQLSISPKTVDSHRRSIRKKLDCKTTAELVRASVRWLERNCD
jgi:DNA-binding NarL/FixJ family response regulator